MIRYDLILKRYGRLDGRDLLEPLLRDVFPGRIALVSSFGIESAVLLHMVAEIDPATPVVFLDTGKLFGETKRYRDDLTSRLGLTDVQSIRPAPADETNMIRTELCGCQIRTCAATFARSNRSNGPCGAFRPGITGRKRFHGGMRSALPTLEVADWRLKANPLAGWSQAEVDSYLERHALPRHPLHERGYGSVGCMPCTDLPRPGAGVRDGRWAGSEKTECGIHWSVNGRPMPNRRRA